MAITSSTIIQEAGRVTFDGGVFYSGDAAITVQLQETKFDIKADMFARIHSRTSNRLYNITVPLVGEYEHLSALYPYGAMALGAQIFSNKTLKINTKSGKVYTFSNAAVTQVPSIRAALGQTLLGSVTFQAILKDGTDPGDSDAYLVVGAEAYGADAYSTAKVLTPVWANAWGASSPWDAFHTIGGITFDFPVTLEAQNVDGLGTVNMVLSDKQATARGIPTGVTLAQILSAVGANSVLGSAPTENDLIVSGTGVYVKLNKALMRDPSFNWHNKTALAGEVTWQAGQTFTDNVADALYLVAEAAPE